MAVMHDYWCSKCDSEQHDCWSDSPPKCCGKKMKVFIGRVNSPEWGGPRSYMHLRDQPFESRSELNAWTKARGLSLGESSEKVRGSRNDEYDKAGKLFSYKGAPTKSNAVFTDGVKRS